MILSLFSVLSVKTATLAQNTKLKRYMKINQTWLRTLGILGLLGGLILFAGDMLFYFDASNANIKMNMGNASDIRILLSGITALIATWFYLLGLVPVYYALKPTKSGVRNTIIISFAGILTAYGIIHGAYVAIATTAKVAVEYQLDIEIVTALASKINQTLRLFVYPLFALLSFLFIYQVWKRKTLYPRWIILFFPLIPFLFRGILGKFLEGSIRIVIMGGYFNLILVIFFAASTIALWKADA